MHSRLTLIAIVFSLVGTLTQGAKAGGDGGPKTSTNAVPRTNSLTPDSITTYTLTRTQGIDSQISGGLGKQQNQQGTVNPRLQQKQNCFKC